MKHYSTVLNHVSVLLVVMLASSAAPIFGADDAEKEDLPTYYVTATVRERALSSATASVTILGREEIEALDVATVAELIRFIPGLEVVSGGSRGAPAFAQIQGGDPNFTVVLLDGVPLNDATSDLGGAVNLNSLSTLQVERVEVVRGPLSSFFGSAGLAGVINIITRRGTSTKPEVGFQIAAGSHDVIQGAVSLSRGTDDQDYFVGVSFEQEEDRIADDEFEQVTLHGNFRSELGDAASLRLTGRVSTWESRDFPEGSGGVLGSGEIRTAENDEISLGLEVELGRKARRHKIYATAHRHDLDRQSPSIFNPANPMASIPASVDETRYLRGRLGWAYTPLATERAKLTVAVEADYEDGESVGALFVPFPLPTAYETDRTTGAALLEFISDRGGPLLIEVGARVDVPEGSSTQFSPRVGLTYRLANDKTRLRFSGGRAFKLPSFFALANPLVGNPSLKPETTLGGDVGVSHRFAKARVTASLSVFAYDYENLIDFVAVPFPLLINRSEVESRGSELAVDWIPGKQLALRTNLTYQKVEDADTGETLVHRPEWVGGARVEWHIAKRLRWHLDGQWASESRDIQLPVPRDIVSGYGLFGTSLIYEISPRWRVDARIDNLLDKEYETQVGFPGSERSFRVGLRYGGS